MPLPIISHADLEALYAYYNSAFFVEGVGVGEGRGEGVDKHV